VRDYRVTPHISGDELLGGILSYIWVNSRFAIYNHLIVTVSVFEMWNPCFFFVLNVVYMFDFLFVCVILFIHLFVYSFILSFLHSFNMSVVSDNTALNYRVVIEQWIRRRDGKSSSLVRRDHGNCKKTQNNKSQPRLESRTIQMQNTSAPYLLITFNIFYVLIFIGPSLTRGTNCDSVFSYLYLIYVRIFLMTSCVFGSVHMQCLCFILYCNQCIISSIL
jgi:hypothetical protein